ncbi:acyl-coenzyme A thioesterase 8-like isoform X2 [Pomacea canaliculata]|uniref:acyl-coenzyme A thioesterase 8-like isoform X2 n=1 Tax=Pomacea canaliculata TaxID=400727 RepID=UPI000D732D20|nr:acyl-coenzyme A thioesterase 8-like isoform X2 [Pomacea canaliculata]
MASEKAAVQTTEKKENFESVIIRSFLNLEKIDVDLYRSKMLWQPQGGRAVFGGQVVGQALAAASYSVPSDHNAHSLHCYFLRPGNYKIPILYLVDRTRDGQTYVGRNIKAMQEGQAIFTMQASFKREEKDPFSHQFKMPDVPPPEQCVDLDKLLIKAIGPEKARLYRYGVRHRMPDDVMAIHRRLADKTDYYVTRPSSARRCIWIKAAGHLGDDHKMHQCCAAYMSDAMLLGTATLPYTGSHAEAQEKMFMTSIDHTVWFHSTFRADDWLLYEMESPVCGEGRGYNTGRMWTRDGRLAISVAQEGVVRTRRTDRSTLLTQTADPLTSKSKL